jgi:hypothetical protein
MLWIMDPHTTINRHVDEQNHPHPRPLTKPLADSVLDGQRRRVDLQTLITEIVVTPWASPPTFHEVNWLVNGSGYTIPVRPSGLAPYRDLLPSTAR